MGDDIAARWRRREFAAGALPELAVAALEAHPAPAHTSLAALLDRLVDGADSDFVPQRDPTAAFGEPPVTVYQGPGFCIEVNLWVNGTTLIHQHAFSGAFQVLHGSSLESRYTFAPERAVGAHLRIGTLTPTGITRLGPGDVRPILAGDGGIHSLFHLDRPSATVVVRTLHERDALPQWSFHPPGVAYDSAWPDTLTALERRQLQLVQSLLALSPGDPRLARLLARARPGFAYPLVCEVLVPTLLRPGVSLRQVREAVERWFASVSLHHVDPLRDAALRRAFTRAAQGLREVLPAPDDRLVAGLLLNAADRAAVEAFFGDDAQDRVVGFLDRCAATANPFAPGVNVLGLGDAGVAHLRARILGSAAPTDPHDAAVDDELCRFGVFGAWFR